MKKLYTFHKGTLMSHLLTLALALALSSCGENPAGPDNPVEREDGDAVVLSATTGYSTGPQTRTEYSGYDETGEVVNADSDYERIDWVAGHDRIRVLCAQSRGATSADYLVGTPTADGEKSVADASDVDGTGPLRWSNDHSQMHYFLAMYPAPGTTSNYHEGAVSDSDASIAPSGTNGTKAVITGSIPSAQPAARVEGSRVYKPDMNRAYMYSTLKTAFTDDGSIMLPFYPLMTAMEFMLVASDDVMADSDLLSLELSSATTDLSGGFTATIDGTDGSKSIAETTGGAKKVTVTLPEGTRLSKGGYTTITVLALGINQTELTLRLNFAGNHARTLQLKNKSGQWITVHACKKAYFKLGVPAEEIFFEVTPIGSFEANTYGEEPVTRGRDQIDNTTDINHGLSKVRYGVFALRNGENVDFDPANNVPNFFLSNRDVSYMNTIPENSDLGEYPTKWRGNAPAYWPFFDRLNFFAYAPYQAQVQPTADSTPTLVIPSADYEKGMLRGTFTPFANVTQQYDLCLATPAMNRFMGTTAGNNVPFTFKHALTRVRFYVNAIGTPYPDYKYQVTDLKLSGILGTNSFTYQNDADNPFVWDTPTADTPLDGSYHLTFNATQLTTSGLNFIASTAGEFEGMVYGTDYDINDFTYVNVQAGRLYLLPQTLTATAQADLELSLLKKSGDTYTFQSLLPPFDVTLPVTTAWAPGTTVSYLITLDLSRMVILDIRAMVSEWQSAGNTHVPLLIF